MASSFGEEIRRERELREISLQDVAKATKINVRYLEALEQNNFEHLPGGVFNKGFVRAYAEYIGVDPEDMVNGYLLEEQAQASHGKTRERGLLRREPRPARPGAAAGKGDAPAAPGASAPARSARARIAWIVVTVAALVAVALLIWVAVALMDRGTETASAGEARYGRNHG